MQETTHHRMEALAEVPARQDWIDGIADRLQQTVEAAYEAGGEQSSELADFLHGVWLGHPLHSVLTDIPIGFWSSSAALDILDMFGGRKALRPGADTTLALGLAGALAAAAAGLTDWQHTTDRPRRIGATHAVVNSTAAILYAGSLLMRLRGRRKRARLLSFTGMGLATYSAYLGGNLVYQERIGVNHSPQDAGPREFTPVMRLEELREGEPHRTSVQGVEVMLLQLSGRVYALANTCAHLGGPLNEGKIEDDCIVCPWHGSRFRLEDGALAGGPSVYNQPAFETRVVSGQIEVRRNVPGSSG